MPSPIPLDPAKRCIAIKANGERCSGVRLRSGELCLAHSDSNPEKVRQRRQRMMEAEGSLDLIGLMELDPTLPENLQRIRIGLMRHVAAGRIEHQAATACLRFAQAAYDAQPHKVKETALGGMMARLMSTEPKPVDG